MQTYTSTWNFWYFCCNLRILLLLLLLLSKTCTVTLPLIGPGSSSFGAFKCCCECDSDSDCDYLTSLRLITAVQMICPWLSDWFQLLLMGKMEWTNALSKKQRTGCIWRVAVETFAAKRLLLVHRWSKPEQVRVWRLNLDRWIDRKL